jgi:1,4-alpha-glucan branching enzyme
MSIVCGQIVRFHCEFANVSEVYIRGTFNSWVKWEMVPSSRENFYYVDLPLSPGVQEYKYYVNGEWFPAGANLELFIDPLSVPHNWLDKVSRLSVRYD